MSIMSEIGTVTSADGGVRVDIKGDVNYKYVKDMVARQIAPATSSRNPAKWRRASTMRSMALRLRRSLRLALPPP